MIPILDKFQLLLSKNLISNKNVTTIYVQRLLITYPDSRGAKQGIIDNITVPFI